MKSIKFIEISRKIIILLKLTLRISRRIIISEERKFAILINLINEIIYFINN
jgi:hypothetical protein